MKAALSKSTDPDKANFLGDIFGRSAVGTLMGAITLGHGLIGGVGPYLWGWIADANGSYALNCIVSAGCYGAVTILLCMINPDAAGKSVYTRAEING